MIIGNIANSQKLRPKNHMQNPDTPNIDMKPDVDMKRVNPFDLFDLWLRDAEQSEINDPNAMTLVTVAADGQPSARMVLLKGHSEDGFIFYTNLESRKASEISATGKVALLFHWKSQRRQIRIEGSISAVDDAIANAYFASRSRSSQLGAWASDQSRPLAERATFEDRFKYFENEFDGKDVPRPSHWSGFLIAPHNIEFWMDREHRLHERWLFERQNVTAIWNRGMLYP